MRLKAYAKINLLLDVVGKRDDGYHDLITIMQSIGLHDVVTVERTAGEGIDIVCDVEGIPTDRRNIVWKACAAFGVTEGLKITLEKHIPSEAGLAGGSADAAAVLTALQAMYPGVTRELLYRVAARVGADVPFCLMGGCCLAQGIGERLTPLPCMPKEYAVALTKPAVSVNTAQAYAAMDGVKLIHVQAGEAVALAQRGDWEALFPLCGNVFEQVTQLPHLAEAKRAALQRGAALVQMSGSGAAVFAVYRGDGLREDVAQALGVWGSKVECYRPVPWGVECL